MCSDKSLVNKPEPKPYSESLAKSIASFLSNSINDIQVQTFLFLMFLYLGEAVN
ncbi:MAG: hypothetical protein CM15mP70_05310 [Pelagibacteraceae bacterium]|nr:MAG: hypothetical protein CM15mP70_05310 [Pelagibacteraceae bacterium]